jgi:tetratricopeptide (TPR) repeat protein
VLTGTVRNVAGKRRLSLRVLDPVGDQVLFSAVLDENEPIGASPKAEEWARAIHNILNADNWSDLVNAKVDPGLRNKDAREDIEAGREWVSRYTVYDLDQAIALFRKALTKEPNSPLAHAYLSMAASCRIYFVADPTYLELAKAEALTALSLDPGSVKARRALASVYFQDGNFSDALEEAMRTVEMGGVEERLTMFAGLTLDNLGRPDRALRWYHIASQLQTKPGEVESAIGDSWVRLGDDEQALRAYDRAIELQPGSSQGAVGKSHVYLLRGEYQAAREICLSRFRNTNELGDMAQIAAQIELFARNYAAADELYTRLTKADAEGGGAFYGGISYQSALGRIKQALGDHGAAAPLLEESLKRARAVFNRQPGNPDAAYRLAAAEASLNLTEAAMQHLRVAAALGWLDYRSLQRDPRFDSLRTNPELDTFTDGLSARVAEIRNNTNAR